jgi:hypothetical protein
MSEPIPMLLYCPRCDKQHVDAPDGVWENPPHRTHRCQGCHYEWRPSDVATTGVRTLSTKGEHDRPANPWTAKTTKPPLVGVEQKINGHG